MDLLLENTNYEEFDDWLQDVAKRHGLIISYDDSGVVHSLEVSPKRGVKQIYIAKTDHLGIAFDHEALFTVRKAGSGLQVFPGFLTGKDVSIIEPLVLEIIRAWPNSKENWEDILVNEIDVINQLKGKAIARAMNLGITLEGKTLPNLISETLKDERETPGRKANPGYDFVFPLWIDGKHAEAFTHWRINFPDESLGMDYVTQKKAFDKAMRRRKEKLIYQTGKVRNP